MVLKFKSWLLMLFIATSANGSSTQGMEDAELYYFNIFSIPAAITTGLSTLSLPVFVWMLLACMLGYLALCKRRLF